MKQDYESIFFDELLQLTKQIVNEFVDAVKNKSKKIDKISFKLSNCLSILWILRNLRENNWIDILNHLQAVSIYKNYKKITVKNALGIQKIVNILLLSKIEDKNLEDVINILIQHEMNPWEVFNEKKY